MSSWFGMWWPPTGKAASDASNGVVFVEKVSLEKLPAMRRPDDDGYFKRVLECN